MLDPAGGWVVLGEFLLLAAGNLHLTVEQDRPGRCRALVDCKDMFGQVRQPYLISSLPRWLSPIGAVQTVKSASASPAFNALETASA